MEENLFDLVKPWLAGAIIVTAVVALAFVAHRIAFAGLERLARQTEGSIDDSLLRHGKRPAWIILTLFGIVLALPYLDLPGEIDAKVGQIVSLLFTAAFG